MSSTALGIALVAFLVVMLGIGAWARTLIDTTEDFIVAGRRLPLSMAWATLLATWFGAGTILTATDEVRVEGLRAAALEPIGAGLCLIIAGLFFARRLWRMQLLTLPELFARRFGVRTEIAASVIMIPGYFGWIAAQFVALAGILELFFGIPAAHGIWLVALVGTAYTLLGGMWSVTLTDVVQLVLLLIGLGVLGVVALAELGAPDGIAAGWLRLMRETPPEKLTLVPTESATALLGWISVLCVAALGNIPGQDLAQRIFAARSARVAVGACYLAGFLYIGFGLVPVLAGLAADLIRPGELQATLPLLASILLSPILGVVFVLALTSAVMSTIDSAILAPSSVLAHNLLAKARPATSGIALTQCAIVAVAAASLAMAYLGPGAYELLETAYAIGLVGLFVPLTMGLYARRGTGRAALASMGTGVGVWLAHLVLGWETFGGTLLGAVQIPQELAATALGWLAYEVVAYAERESWHLGRVRERDASR